MYNALKIKALKIFIKSLKNDESGTSELALRRKANELHAMDDRELDDLGLSRGMIEHAVRYGRDSGNFEANERY